MRQISYCSSNMDMSWIGRKDWFRRIAMLMGQALEAEVVPDAPWFQFDPSWREMVANIEGKIVYYDFAARTNIHYPVKKQQCDLHLKHSGLTEFVFPMLWEEKHAANDWHVRRPEVYFRGSWKWEVRQQIRPFIAGVISETRTENDYFNDIANYRFGLSIPGVYHWCFRDMEILSVRSVLIRPLVPNHIGIVPYTHYLPLEGGHETWADQIQSYLNMDPLELGDISECGYRFFIEHLSDDAFVRRVRHVCRLKGII